MPRIRFGPARVPARAVVFDKDGTLVEFHRLWGVRAERGIDALLDATSDESLVAAMCRTIGFDRDRRRTIGDSPWATSPIGEIVVIAATVLYQRGYDWERSRQLAEQCFGAALEAMPEAGDLVPCGDLPALMGRLTSAGVACVVATTDSRVPAEATLRLLGIESYVPLLCCGDDRDRPRKPSPATLGYVAERLDVTPSEIVMVSDTVSDLAMALAAGAALRVGVLGGAGDADALRRHADVVIETLDEIGIDA
jgi:phosphoglycolate phosphatase-like HAD superfamily hydrolase